MLRSVVEAACDAPARVVACGERPRRSAAGDRGRQVLMAVLTDLRRRGGQDVLVRCVDGRKGFPEAIEATLPQAWVQTCIVHLIRASLRYVNHVTPRRSPPRPIHNAPQCRAGASGARALQEQWDQPCPPTVRASRDAWERVITFPRRYPRSCAAPSTRPTRS